MSKSLLGCVFVVSFVVFVLCNLVGIVIGECITLISTDRNVKTAYYCHDIPVSKLKDDLTAILTEVCKD